jgi:adenosine deaminase
MRVSLSDDFMNVSESFKWDMTDVIAVTRNAITGSFCDADCKAALSYKMDDYVRSLADGRS